MTIQEVAKQSAKSTKIKVKIFIREDKDLVSKFNPIERYQIIVKGIKKVASTASMSKKHVRHEEYNQN